MGTPEAAAVSLRRIVADGHEILAVYTQPDRPSGRGNKVVFSAVKQAAIELGIPVIQPLKIKAAETVEEFKAFEADIAVVVAYGRILPEAYLQAFPLGAVNVHFSLLPKYRGAAPVNWAIVNGEETTGVTTMVMDAGLDTGDILLQRQTAIGEFENSIDLMRRLAEIGAELLSETLEKFDSIKPTPQDNEAATFAPIMNKLDGLIDWNASARDISRRIRGFQPFPSAHTTFRGGLMKIWDAVPVAVETSTRAGEITQTGNQGLVVGCHEGDAIRVLSLQPEGKRRMDAQDFINGMKPAIGERFGER